MVRFFNAVLLVCVVAAGGCGSDDSSNGSPTSPGQALSPPAIESPANDQLVNSLRPTLVIRNGSSTQAGARTYDFQVANNSGFTSTLFSKQGVAEGAGTTSVQVDVDLPPATVYYWRARTTQGSAASEWVSAHFTTKEGSFSRPGALLDVLTDGTTIGERFGSTTFIPGRGLRIDDANSYVRYRLPATVSAGEFSMEVEGLAPDGPAGKQAIFAMARGTGAITGSPYEMFAQYRGSSGNPDNCITFKAVWGSIAYKLEFSFGQRSSAVFRLNPSTTYFWQGTWTRTAFRLIVREGGIGGTTIYNRAITASGGGPYAPNPHVAYLGSNSGAEGTDHGSFTGMIVRNVWLGAGPRPSSLGEAGGGR